MKSFFLYLTFFAISLYMVSCGDDNTTNNNNNGGGGNNETLLVSIDSFSLRPASGLTMDTLTLDLLSNMLGEYDTLRIEFQCTTNDTSSVRCWFRIPDHQTVLEIHYYYLNGIELNSNFSFIMRRYYYNTETYLYLERFGLNPNSFILCKNIKVWKIIN